MTDEIKIERLNRKIAKRDKKIAGMQRQIDQLESVLSRRTIDLPKDIQRAVTDALCNVRMIPVFPFRNTERIVEVRSYQEKSK